ncbi:MAG: hypothetical protein ABS876_01620 [Ruminococcus sp.]
MLNYTFALRQGRKTIPVVVFEDAAYHLAGEFLLAERGILSQIAAVLDADGDDSISGSAFTLEKRGALCVITNDMTEKSLELPTDDLRALTSDYRAEVKRLRKRQ